ncbi:Transposon Ty3-I Gag-Pol polyprotein [Acropora cervicornis]|uniref:Transposon Ty3-I Gag-Pol polyprotein n=1 Tax=Acropora cervicornis TaxID=6130 RepID=A0AAD9Q065_ACRCE|nr:Transposon Ty3-I Gag-Pol polyprotein [Acropora cervicornis]
MANAKWFTKLDANRGYWQIPLDEESQLLTTFNTPFGRFCYQVTPFGIKSAQEVFQKRMSQNVSDLEGVETDIDDIIVHAETEVKHDQRLHSVLERCEKINLTLNKEKCIFKCEEVTHIGHKLTKDGIKPDDNKVRAINEMPAPSDKKGVERLLGTVNYLGKFIPNLATVTEPIRILLRKDTEFEWSYEQDQAFQEIKAILTKDGGPVVRGSVAPVAYASRSLTEAESRYAQIEKGLLAVQFSLERFNQYTYGKKVAIESDHKPLEAIVKKPLAAAPPRLQRILLRMQKYDYALEYKPGKELVLPDMLSRAPVSPTVDDNMEEEIALHVHLVRRTLPVTESKWEEIRRATTEAQSMRTLSETIKYGWPETKGEIPVSIHAYWDVRDELSELNGVVLRGDRIVIPPSMRKEMLEKIHQGHMGIEKSKRRARDTLYWPGMNSQITDTVSRCTICLEHRRQNAKEPMIPFRVPTKPWELVATDLFTWDKSEYFIIVDYHSRFFEVAKLPDTKSITFITHVKSTFPRHGIPSEVISDNGPQYSSKEFESFAKSWEFKHTTTSPLNPKANGLVEKAVQTVKSLLPKAKQDSRDPYLALLEYRNTPIDDVGSPAQLLMSRRLRSIIPTSDALLKPKVLDAHKVMEKMELKQRKQKHYFDRQTKALPVLETGDRIRVRMGNSCKPGRVVQHAETPRSYEIQTDEGRKYRRNRRMLIKCSEDDRSSIDSPFVSNSPTTSTHERPYFKESVDKVSPLVEGPTVTLPQPEELCSTDEDIKERQP